MAENKITIKETKIGTPDSGTGGLNLCTGVPLFPPFPTIPLGWQTKNAGALHIGKRFKILVVRVSAEASFGLQAGLCGPSYALRFNAEGEVEDGVLTLTIEEDESMAGIFLGAGLQAGVELKAQIYKIRWHWGPHGSWRTKFHIRLDVGIDILKAAIDIIAALLQIEDMIAKGAVEGASDTPLAMIGEGSDLYAISRGVIDLDCVFSVPINLWTLVVIAAAATLEVPFLDVASAAILVVHEALDVTLSSIGFGPTIGVDVPISIQIQDVDIDNVKFTNKTITSDGKWVGEQADKTIEVPADPKEISFTMVHNAGFDIMIGLYAELQLVEIFHVGTSTDMGILGLFNIQPKGGNFHHTLKNTIGNDWLASGCDCGKLYKDAGLVDVEFV